MLLLDVLVRGINLHTHLVVAEATCLTVSLVNVI